MNLKLHTPTLDSTMNRDWMNVKQEAQKSAPNVEPNSVGKYPSGDAQSKPCGEGITVSSTVSVLNGQVVIRESGGAARR